MQAHDVLLTTAELAVAFVGFAGIVVVLQRRQSAWEGANLQRFWAMLISALLVLVFSLLPLPFIASGRSCETTWAICSAAMAVFVGAETVWFVIVALGRVPRFRGVLSAMLLPFALSSLVILVLNMLDVGFHRSFAGYLVGHFYLIGSSGAFFIRLVYLGLAAGSGKGGRDGAA